MADNIEVKITRREAIKPCSPTPQHLKIVKLSMLDQFSPDMYVPLILFYPFIPDNNLQTQNPIEIASERLRHLRETLSKALALYYPFAGRLKNNLFIECNDEGAEFLEAKAEISISKILDKPDYEMLNNFLPLQPQSRQALLGGSLLFIQATIFNCGGIALGFSISHKISDACTLAAFIKTWSKTACNKTIIKPPEFGVTCHFFPTNPENSGSAASAFELVQDKCVTRRFFFQAEKIAALKSKVSSESQVENLTRVEVVSALIWKCAMEASASRLSDNSSTSPRISILGPAVNLRKRFVPPLEENVVGNFYGGYSATTYLGSELVSLEGLVGKFRKGMKEIEQMYTNKGYLEEFKKLDPKKYAYLMTSDEIDYYSCSSWCRFGFYDTDLGFGPPVWASKVALPYKNIVELMDSRDGDGIEAWLTFKEQDMALIESNQELLAYTLLNPSVV